MKKPVRITEQVWPEGTAPAVSILCITYNHAEFIRDAIEGFLMQETTFPIEILIHDDASTDGTGDIVRSYQEKHPTIIRTVLQKKNQWSRGARSFKRFMSLSRGEFVALCEGDDYWSHSGKLQNQMAAILRSSDVILCGCRCNVLEAETNTLTETTSGPCDVPLEIFARDFFPGDPAVPWIHTCTRIVPKNALLEIPKAYLLDTLMLHWLVTRYPDHRVVCLPEVAGVYRLHGGGFWSSMEKLSKARAMAGIYSKAAGLHKGHNKVVLLRKAIEQAQLLSRSENVSFVSRLFWGMQLRVLQALHSFHTRRNRRLRLRSLSPL